MARASSWGDLVPDTVVVIVAGVDVQMDRIEVEIVGWGRGEESWSLEYHSLPGNPAEPDVWQRLDELLLRKRRHRVLGDMKVAACCVDAGNWSQRVYAFTGPRFYRRVFAIKGASDPRTPIWPRRPSRPKDGRASALFSVGSVAAKEITVARLGIEQPGAGFCHFPADRDFDYFEMLLAEKPIRKFIKGVPHRVWVKASNARNEALDTRCYGLCALHALRSYGYNLDREADRVAALVRDFDPTKPAPARQTWDIFGKMER
jgi:phage terminase large subunit GpA-like protein